MTTAMLEKRLTVLEREVRVLRTVVQPRNYAHRLSSGLREAMLDIKAGRVYGPFSSIKALRKSLES